MHALPCLGTWSSAGLVGFGTVLPREGRIVASVLATSAANDWLQTAFTLLASRASASGAEAEIRNAEASTAAGG